MSTVRTNNILDASGGNTATINSMTPTADSLQGFRNRIINGDMRIDQRNDGASVTQTTGTLYPIDRWNINGSATSKFTAQRSTTAPSGFTNSLLITSSAATTVSTGDYYYLMQGIEGFNVADLGWGAAGAKTITLSFWVRSSLTGTFGGTLRNKISGANRSYPFTYTINAANTFEYKTITVTGDTTGTWATDNSCSLTVCFSFGAGSTYSGTAGAWAGSNLISATGATNLVSTNGATFYITGVQLEVGSVATPFERRDYGTELSLCQRYYYKTSGSAFTGSRITQAGYAVSTTVARVSNVFPVPMRATPSALEQSGTAGQYSVVGFGSVRTTCSAIPAFSDAQTDHATTAFTVASGLTAWTGGQGAAENVTTPSATVAYLAWSVEL